MIEGVDYKFTYPPKDKESVYVNIIDGKYKDTVFKYGKVTFDESDGTPRLIYAFDVIESTIMKPKKLQKDPDFKQYAGDLLVSIIAGNLDEEIVDDNRDYDSTELGDE